jgi:ribulose-phosphate 3-epimerase
MSEIIPAIVAKDSKELEGMLGRVDGLTDWVQIDLVDGSFAGTRTVTPEDLKQASFQGMIEIHLMVDDPGSWIDRLEGLPVSRIIAPLESVSDVAALSELVHKQGREFGLGLNPETDVDLLLPHLGSVDRVLILAVQPGYQAQGFQPEALEKVKRIREANAEIPIQVDGGVRPDNAEEIIKAGATSLAVGSFLQEAPDPAEAIEELKRAAEGSDDTG